MMNAVKSKTTQANVVGIGFWLIVIGVLRTKFPGLTVWPEGADVEVIGGVAGVLGTLTARGWRFWRSPSVRTRAKKNKAKRVADKKRSFPPYNAAVGLLLCFSLALGVGLPGCVTDDNGNTRLDLPTVIAFVETAISYWEGFDAERDAVDAVDAAERELERVARLAELRPLVEVLRSELPGGVLTDELWRQYLNVIGASSKSERQLK